jgi:hypothetical protein
MAEAAKKICLVSSFQNMNVAGAVHSVDLGTSRRLVSSILSRIVPIVMESRFLVGGGMCLRIPTKTSEFDRVVLSKRNDMSLCNLLPKPYSEVVGDHSYTPILSQVQWFALTQSETPVKAREDKMIETPGFQEFLKRVLPLPASPGTPTVVVKVIFWMDGYDPNSSSRTNRTGCWAATTTFVFNLHFSSEELKLFKTRAYDKDKACPAHIDLALACSLVLLFISV